MYVSQFGCSTICLFLNLDVANLFEVNDRVFCLIVNNYRMHDKMKCKFALKDYLSV
jgi:hypothetical protein